MRGGRARLLRAASADCATRPCWASWRAERLTQCERRRRPLAASAAHRRQASARPTAERHDEAGLLGDRDEAAGRHQAALGVLPAHQRLDAHDRAGRQRDDRAGSGARTRALDARGAGRSPAGAIQRRRRACRRRRARTPSRPAPWPGTSRRPRRAEVLGVVAESAASAMPMLALRSTSPAAEVRTARPSARAAARRRAIASSSAPRSSSSTANSSPPNRATVSAGGRMLRSRSATATSSSSPAGGRGCR